MKKLTKVIFGICAVLVLLCGGVAGGVALDGYINNGQQNEIVIEKQQEIDAISNVLAEIQSEFEIKKDECVTLKANLQDATNQLETAKAQEIQDAETIESLNTQVSTLQTQLNDKISELNQMQEQLTDLQSTLSALQITYSALQTESEEDKATIANLNSQIETLQEKIDKLQNIDPSDAFDIVLDNIQNYTFANCSWEQIAKISEKGLANVFFNIGDEKTFEFDCINHETVTVAIMGFNHDDLADGSGKAGITLGMTNLLYTRYSMNWATVNDDGSLSRSNVGGWKESNMHKTFENMLAEFPSDLQSSIKAVNKNTSAGNGSTSVITSTDKLWLFSEVEIDGTTAATYCDEGVQYEYWKSIKDGTNAADRIKYTANGTDVVKNWWLRSANINDRYSFLCINTNGEIGIHYSDNLFGACFGFCI